MMRSALALSLIGLLCAPQLAYSLGTPAQAQGSVTPVPDAASMAAAMVAQGLLPQPSNIVPGSEVTGGAVGTDATMFALANHQHPRITRATVTTTASDGTFAVTWTNPLSSASPVISLIPVQATAGTAVTCKLTAAATATTVTGRCYTDSSALLNLSIVTAGLTVGPVPVGAGVQVNVIALPPAA